MKMTPQDILRHLGFDIPDDGVDINPADAAYFASALNLLGKTMSADSISDEDLHLRHAVLLGTQGKFSGTDPGVDSKEAEKSRASLRIAFSQRFGATV